MWMRGEQLKIFSALFSPRFQRENRGDRDCVWHGREKKKKKRNTKIYLISIRESCSEGWIKTKEPPWLCGTSHTQNQGHSGLLRTKHWHAKKKKKWGTHYGISDLKFRGKIYGAIVPVDEESHLNHFETCFRDLLQKLEPIQMRWIRRLIINIPMWRADPYCALFGATQCTRLFNGSYALM